MQENIRHSFERSSQTLQHDRSATMAPVAEVDKGNTMRSAIEDPGSSRHPCVHQPHDLRPNTNSTTPPLSARSSFSDSSASSSSTSSRNQQLFLKSSLKSTQPTTAQTNRKPSPSQQVRFAESDMDTSKKSPGQSERRQKTTRDRNGYPNPLLQFQHRPANSMSPSHHIRSASNPQISHMKIRPQHRNSAPVQPLQSDSRWSAVPLPEGFAPPRLTPGSRVTSFQSLASNLSVQSAPAALPDTNSSAPPGQYNPLDHYVPCVYGNCNTHYTVAHVGFTYYLPQGPYSLSRHHGYCQHHAARELKEASAMCKREFEVSRQNCGRKTLGQIQQAFDLFLKNVREERKVEDADLQSRQRAIVLGDSPSSNKVTENTSWDWRYMPRPCTKPSCQTEHYSPFANHLFTYYTTPRPSKFFPQQTLCPSCSKSEVENFEVTVQEKWSSRTEWDEVEWNQWFDNAIKDRDMELAYQESNQERIAKDKGPAKRKNDSAPIANTEGKETTEKKEKRKSFFKRFLTITV